METLAKGPLLKIELRYGIHSDNTLGEIVECRDRARKLFTQNTINFYFLETANGTPSFLESMRELYDLKGSYLAAVFQILHLEDLSKKEADLRLTQIAQQYYAKPNPSQVEGMALSQLWHFKSLDELVEGGSTMELEMETLTAEELKEFSGKHTQRIKAESESRESAKRGDVEGVLININDFLRLTAVLDTERHKRDTAKVLNYALDAVTNQQPTCIFLRRGLLHRRALTQMLSEQLSTYGNKVEIKASSSCENDGALENPVYSYCFQPGYQPSRQELLRAAFFSWGSSLLGESNQSIRQNVEKISKTLHWTQPEELEQLITRIPREGFAPSISHLIASKLW